MLMAVSLLAFPWATSGVLAAIVAAVERVRKQLARLIERRPRAATPAPDEWPSTRVAPTALTARHVRSS